MSVLTAPRTPESGDAPRRSTGATASQERATAVARIRFRRALTLLGMTLFLPGSAQLVAGNKRVGRLALRVWLGCLAGTAAVVGLGMLWHGFAFTFFSHTFVLLLIRLGLAGLAIGWAGLFLDAWRLGSPSRLEGRRRVATAALSGLLVLAVSGTLLYASHLVSVQRDFIRTMFGDGVASSAEHGRYNILLVGGDSGSDRWGLRTDSMTVASVDEETGRTILFGLPRNMSNFPFPEGSVMAEQFPQGFDCEGCELNGLATWAADHKKLFKGVDDPGIEATIQGVEGITGLKINYHVMVDLAGFRNLVKAMGGLTLNVRDDIPIGGGEQGQIGTIKAGVRKLNAYEVLWFARSRMAADDYSRMARQKCVMNAMLQQARPKTVITNFEGIAKAGQSLIETNLPASELDTFAELAMKARSQKVSSVSFVPPAINTGNPDIDKIRTMIDNAIDRSEGKGAKVQAAADKSATGFNAGHRGASTGGSIGSMGQGYAANQAQNLSSAC